MTLREYLEQRQRELEQQLADLHRQLAPLESELAEVKRSKAAIGIVEATVGPNRPTIVHGIAVPVAQETQHSAAMGGRAVGALKANLADEGTPYDRMTMKQLVVKVLTDHFHNGATTRQMLDFFRDAWGRDIQRANLSPQISRLYDEGAIGRIRSTRGWFLYQDAVLLDALRPYLHRGRIVWVAPDATNLEYEPLMAKKIAVEVSHDRMPYKRTETTTMPNGIVDRRVTLVWLLPREVGSRDMPALRHEFPPPDDDEG